jgi:5-methylthioadenosine/S-adenosylhomocysteine deaminase
MNEVSAALLTAGAAADIVLLDFSDAATQPVHDPVSTLVYAASAAHVHTTICDGRVLMHDRVVEVCDEAEVIAAARRSAAAVTEGAA